VVPIGQSDHGSDQVGWLWRLGRVEGALDHSLWEVFIRSFAAPFEYTCLVMAASAAMS